MQEARSRHRPGIPWPPLPWAAIAASRVTDEDNPSGTEALRQKLDGADDSSADPRGTETRCYTDLFFGHIAGSVAVDELDPIGDPKLFSAQLRLLAEQLTYVDTGAANPVVARPSA